MRRRPRAARLAALLMLGLVAPIAAQVSPRPAAPGTTGPTTSSAAAGASTAESSSAGWTITPSIGVSSFWDDNPTLASEGDFRPGDTVTSVRPNLSSAFRGRRTTFALGYGGTFDFYRNLTEQNTQDHRGTIDFAHQATRRLSFFARDQAMLAPTTGDAAELGATVLRRQTTRMNTFRGGFDAALARHTTLTASYNTQWIDFETAADDPATAALQGGVAHGGSGSLRQQVNARVSYGADYDVQRALVGRDEALFDVQSVLGVAEIALNRHVEASLGYGHAWLFTGDGVRRNGPSVRVGLSWQGKRAVGTLRYARSFLPSFGFGGTFQNEELRADLNVPVNRSIFWSGGLVATKSDPLLEGDPNLRGVSAQSALGVRIKRRFRIELYGAHVFQDSSAAGGRVHRTRAGVQASIATPVRIR